MQVGNHNIPSIVYQADCGVLQADLGEICFSDHFKTLNYSIVSLITLVHSKVV